MTDDPQDKNTNDYNDDKGGGGNRPNFPGGGGGIGALLPLLLGLFKGKGIIVLLALAAGAYFLLGKGGGCSAGGLQDIISQFSQSGYSFNPDEFNKASVYEELDETNPGNALPEAVSLLQYAPPRGDQGQQGSCVAWSSAYAAQTVLTAAATHQDPASIAFSPSYLYNQIKLEGCQGSYIQRAMEAMQRNGGVPISQYPYDQQDCDRMPSSGDVNAGRQNTIHGFTRLTSGDNINAISVRAVKEHLSKDAPVVIGMMVGQSFMQDMMGKELWTPQGMDASQVGMGGHAMCVIGYDDRKFGGAFQIMNSWSERWGNNGVGWVRYGDFKSYVKEAYGIDPLPKRSNVANIPLECIIGLVRNDDKQYIQLRSAGANTFQTTSPIKPGTRFKMEIKNETECYIYIFGAESDGKTSYVLFPYLKPGETVSKHSPYCGITGYRLFPKGQSMEPDNVGTRDYIAVVVSKDELDYNSINNSITQAAGSSYAEKVNSALRGILIPSAKFMSTSEGNIYFKVDANSNKAVASIVAFDKN
ncbi:MAG: peptidase C1A papain [Chitinophagaceae bacterium]|nr:peptidase C1A papain [Chitinophagaceae bacterium]